MTNISKLDRFFIYDGIGPVDGDFYDRKRLLDMVEYHTKPDYVILGFDHSQVATGKIELVDCTEEIATDWWEGDGRTSGEAETLGNISGGHEPCWLATRFYAREVAVMERQVWADENAADAWRDERMDRIAEHAA